MKNIILIGMPAVGKSTVGVLLAKTLCLDFVDTDLLLQRKSGMSLCEYIGKLGGKNFINFENETLADLELHNSVIATGGSAVYGKDAMKSLKTDGIAVWLHADENTIAERIGNIRLRGVVQTHGGTVAEIIKERTPLYRQYADVTIDCDNLTPEQTVEKIVSELEGFEYNKKTGGSSI